MDLDSNTDEYQTIAAQIFQYYGVETSGSIHVDTLMDKFEPFVKANKSEYNCLRSLLDPDLNNREINMKELAAALNIYSETKHSKVDLDESFNLKCGQVPQDSDSGISTDGFQQLEELQHELRARTREAGRLRAQLDADEEALATLSAERDSLKSHLHVLREENASLRDARADYDDAAERLRAADAELCGARRDADALRRRERALTCRVEELEAERASLQELLGQSKAEAHRLNELYATRQRSLLEQCETLRADGAALGARLRAQAERAAQLMHEKTALEQELKDVLNKSCAGPRSVDVSYTEEQMLHALDSLNAESKFVTGNLLTEDSFLNALKDDQGRSTNVSLFDEIRCSLGLRAPRSDAATQTDDTEPNCFDNKAECGNKGCFDNKAEFGNKGCFDNKAEFGNKGCFDNKAEFACSTPGGEAYASRLEARLETSEKRSLELRKTLELYEMQMDVMQGYVDDGNAANSLLQAVVDKLKDKLSALEAASEDIKAKLDSIGCDGSGIEVSSVGVQASAPCGECVQRTARAEEPVGLLRRYLWHPLKSLFSVFAGVLLVSALLVLYNVSNYHFAARRCVRSAPATPWRWFSVHDLLDFLFRIEYIGEVPV